LAAISADCLVHLFITVHMLFQLLTFCCAKIASHTLHLTFAPTLINCMPEVFLKTNAVTTTLILVGTFMGSYINIPLLKLKTTVSIIKEEFVNFFGVLYRIPHVEYGKAITVVAVNAGGALIPTAVSLYSLIQNCNPYHIV
jgi:uncharacterized membrane protein